MNSKMKNDLEIFRVWVNYLKQIGM
jgi:hypothetical protein